MTSSPTRGFIVLLGFLIGLSPLAINMYLPSMPTIIEDLSASPQAVQTTVSIYLIFFGLPQLFFGPLSDALGRRFTIFCGLLCFLGGSLLCSIAPSIEVLIIARALQGTGSAAISVTVPALVKDRFEGVVYTNTVGFIMMVMAIAPLIAPILGGFVFALGGWRSIFYLLTAIALVCAILFKVSIHETLRPHLRKPFRLKPLLKNYAMLLSDRHCLGLALCIGFMLAGLMAFITGSPFVFINLYGVDPTLYGFLFGINVIAMMAVTYANNRLIHFFSNEILLRACIVAIVLASSYLLLLSRVESPALPWVVFGCMLYIANLGMLTANIQVILLSRFSAIAGATSAIIGSLRFGVGSLGGVAISIFHEQSATPLVAVMGTCGLCVLGAYWLAGKKPVDDNNLTVNNQ